MVQTVDPAHGIDQKTCNIRAIVARNGGCGAVAARESLTTVGDYAIFHWVRSRIGAGLPRSPQNPAGPKGSQTLNFSGPAQARAAWISSLAIATSKETAGHRTSSGQTMPDEGQGVRSTDREAQTISLQRRWRKKQSRGRSLKDFGLWPGR